MREEKPKSPSQKNKNAKTKSWFWPAVYSGIAIVFVCMIWGYNAFLKDSPEQSEGGQDGVVVDVNAAKETLKYPFDEELLDDVAILQEYYDTEADESQRENALLVFNQQYVTNTGVSISVDGKPFEIVAALSGTVEDVIIDTFKGSEITLLHADGMKTIYRSVSEILVQKGDEVVQGQPLGTATQNEWNPTAGVHLHFEVQKEGVAVNPRTYLGF